MALTESLRGHTVYIDANLIIYAIEAHERYVRLTTALLGDIEEEKVTSWTSEISLAETLVKPIADEKLALQQAYENFFSYSKVRVAVVSRDVLLKAAQLRARRPSLRLLDAIHLATAIIAGCDRFLTNDLSLGNVETPPVVLLSEFVS